jgi:hypothetical protein
MEGQFSLPPALKFFCIQTILLMLSSHLPCLPKEYYGTGSVIRIYRCFLPPKHNLLFSVKYIQGGLCKSCKSQVLSYMHFIIILVLILIYVRFCCFNNDYVGLFSSTLFPSFYRSCFPSFPTCYLPLSIL